MSNDHNHHPNEGQRMGDLFQKQREQRRAQQQSAAPATNSSLASSSFNNSSNSNNSNSQYHHHDSTSSSRTSSSRNNNNNNNNSRGPQQRSRGGRTQQQQQQHSPFAHLPLEQGVICTLRDSFGFIHCADRPEQVFFHYSQLTGHLHPHDLQLDLEVEFRIGPSPKDADKLACFQVHLLPAGTRIEWETVVQERVRGFVEQACVPSHSSHGARDMNHNNSNSNNNAAFGTIRIVEQDAPNETTTSPDNNNNNNKPVTDQKHSHTNANTSTAAAPASAAPATANNNNSSNNTSSSPPTGNNMVVKFTAADYNANELSEPPQESRFERPKPRGGRLHKGDLVECTVVRDRRTRDLVARHVHLIFSEKERARQAAEAQLLANATVEQGVITSLKGDYGFLKSNRRREPIYFHYSSIELDDDGDDDDDDDDHSKDSGGGAGGGAAGKSNRNNKSDSGGSGSWVLKEGQEMKFLVVTEHPDSAGDQPRRRVSARQVKMEPRGSVKFHIVLATGVVGMVSIPPQPQDSGHLLDLQGKVVLSKPLPDGDDFVRQVYLSAKDCPGGSFAYRGGSSVGMWIEAGDTLLFDVVKDFADGACRAVPTRHLVPRENPADLASDELGNSNGDDNDNNVPAIRLQSLALASRAEGTVNALKENYGFVHFCERPVDAHFKLFQLLPDELQKDLRRNMGLEDFDSQGNPLELTVGAEAQFDMSVHGSIQSHAISRPRGRPASHPHERENLKAQRVLLLPPGTIRQVFHLGKGVRGVVSKDNPKQPYSGSVDLDEAINPVPFEDRHSLVAKMIDDFLASPYDMPIVFHDVQSLKEDDTVIDMIERRGEGRLTWTHIPQADQSSYPGRLCIRKIKSQNGQGESEEKLQQGDHGDSDESKTETSVVDESAIPITENEKGSEKDVKTSGTPRKRNPKIQNPVKTIRFDKSNLSKELRDDTPPGVNDVVEFDVIQSRRTGQLQVENMKMISRKAQEVQPTESANLGVVKEIVAARKFGFISVIDRFEMLFFSLASVNTSEMDSNEPNAPRNKIRKGDEVKFDIGTEKGGKRVALNVTVLPKGTIPCTADKNACRGLVLMEPSHTNLKNTPIRPSKSNVSQSSDKSSRWDSFDSGKKQHSSAEPVTEQGCILLLEDSTGVFDLKKADSAEGVSSADSNKESTTLRAETDGDKLVSPTYCHVRYKTTAIAVHGSGSSCATDESSKPRRGDLVSFVNSKKDSSGVRDIRIIERGAASSVRGRLEGINADDSGGVAKFIVGTERGEEIYQVDLAEIVSCDPFVLKEKEPVEGILYEGSIYGICRTADLYLESKVGANRKERPKLNLTVKKDRGGTIMAQSMMAKGPDAGTNGFAPGWTSRMSAYAAPFVPNNMVLEAAESTSQTMQPETSA